MIHHDIHDDRHSKRRFISEDTLWIITGVIVSLSLLAIVYFGLTLYTAY